MLLVLAAAARGQSTTLVFLTVKDGEQTAQGSGDTLFHTLAEKHGPLQGDRTVTNQGAELDFYAVTPHKYGVAVGLEIMDYDKTFRFFDATGALPPERLHLNARSVLFNLKGFLRFGDFLPFVGLGTGTYYANYNEQVSGVSFLDAATNVFSYRAGFRWLIAGRWGVLVETGQTSAPLHVVSNGTDNTLELGGAFTNVGISYVW